MVNTRFNLRVYGILVNDRNEILLSEDCRDGFPFTKFPGGGLEFGESLQAGLIREFQEEIGIEIHVGECLYHNDFVQLSAFNPNEQLFVFYYRVNYASCDAIVTSEKPITNDQDYELRRWVPLNELTEECVTFPIDKHFVRQLNMLL
jgi:8-oxo-dGTP diphosphatase